MEQGLISIDYSVGSKDVTLVFESDAPYEIEDVTAYVDDMTEGKSMRIVIYEQTTLMHDLVRIKDGWLDARSGHDV